MEARHHLTVKDIFMRLSEVRVKTLILTLCGIAVFSYFVLRANGGPTWPPLDERSVYTSYYGCQYKEQDGKKFIVVDKGDEIEGPDGRLYGLLNTESWRCKEYDDGYR